MFIWQTYLWTFGELSTCNGLQNLYCISGTDTCSTCWAHTYLILWTSYFAIRITNTAQWSMLAWSLTQGLNTVCFNVFRTKIIQLQQYKAGDAKLLVYIYRERTILSLIFIITVWLSKIVKLHFAQDYPYKLYCFFSSFCLRWNCWEWVS